MEQTARAAPLPRPTAPSHDELDRRLHEHGASLWNWVLLREAANADGASQRELAELMRIEPPTLVRHLDKLADDGLVERRPDPDDRRRPARRRHRRPGASGSPQLHEVVHERRRRAARRSSTEREVEVLGNALHAHPRPLHRGEHDAAEARRADQR